MIEKFTISRDDSIYEAFPDVALAESGALVCVFAECMHHGDRSYTRIMLATSTDRGRSWSHKRPLTEATKGRPWFNCPRITALPDGRLVVLVDKLYREERSARPDDCRNFLYFSDDEGQTWSDPVRIPALGIVPDRLLALPGGRWIVSCHYRDVGNGDLVQRLWYSDDEGAHWSDAVVVGREPGVDLCEVSILPVGPSLVALFRENTGIGRPCYKSVSHDRGESWSAAVPFPLPACHRPVAGHLREGYVLITHRYMQGGKGWPGWPTQNLFAALTDAESLLSDAYHKAHTRILPIDFDRSTQSDTGYSGWVQFDDGEIYIVNYIVDDAPNGQIRGYSLSLADFLIA